MNGGKPTQDQLDAIRKAFKRRDDISEKLQAGEKICMSCCYFVEHRTPEMTEEHGKFSGACIYKDELGLDTTSKKSEKLTVMGDSLCGRWTSLFLRERN